jgi:hypothetical protein
MRERATAREAQLKREVALLQAQLRLREQQLFGREADSTATADGSPAPIEHHGRGGNNAASRAPDAGIIPLCPLSSR